ncbi:MAG: 4Fe-4S binding protein [Candidatus Bathyarchaeia archaeon]
MVHFKMQLLAKRYTLIRMILRIIFLALLIGFPIRYILDEPLILPISLPPNLGQNFAVPALDLMISMLSYVSLPAIPLTIILLLPLLLGRAMCSWICPIGLLHEIASPKRKEGKITPYRNIKYAMLAVALLMALVIALQKLSNKEGISFLENALGSFSFLATLIDPSSLIFDFLPVVIHTSLKQQQFSLDIFFQLLQLPPIFWTRLITLFIIILGVSRIPWFWCKYACPSGAAQAFASRFSFLHLRRELHRCSNCKMCQKACPMDVPILQEDWKDITNAECTLCLRCVEECKNKALRLVLL